MMKRKAAVFASGTGSNFSAIMEAGSLGCDIVLLFSDNPSAKVLQKAEGFSVSSQAFSPKSFVNKEAYEKEILRLLQEHDIEWIFLAGYMRLIGSVLLEKYEGRIVNIHPSYLPQFPGKDAIDQAIEAGANETGVTIHYVDAGMDTGPIIRQEKIAINKEDTKATLAERIHKLEHQMYPEVIRQLMKK